MATEPPIEAWELELDTEEVRVRLHRQRFLERSGFSDFAAFRIAMRLEIEKERAAHLLDQAHDEDWVLDQLLD